MKKFIVKKIMKQKKGYPLMIKTVGTVTAFSYPDAMQKAAKRWNRGNWADLSVTPENL